MSDLEVAISHAVERDELVLRYQPIVSLSTGEVEAHEALVRWAHPGSGLLRPPAAFIPAAEGSDLICQLGAWVIDRVAFQLASWNASESGFPVVAVNVSGRHVNSARIRDDVLTALSRHDVRPDQLVLEITETVRVDSDGLENLHELRSQGIALSLDDFGTGHNTDEQLSRLPVDLVKIDRRFLDLGTRSSYDLLDDMVERAHASGLAVVAEGVEQAEHLEVLERLAVEFAQGFLLGRPRWPADTHV